MDRENLFLDVLKANHGRWRAIARSYAANDAEDLFQEILLQIWRSLDSFRGESASNTWCYRVALNTAMSWRRSDRTRRARLPISDGYCTSQVPAPSATSAATRILEQLLAEQTPTDRAIMLLYLDNLSYSEMAEILGASEGSLRVRIHRLKQRLAEMYQELSHEF